MIEKDSSERIRQKAHDLFMQYGLRSVSMDDIATALGMSKKTIYQYYADKDALVAAVISSILEHNRESCEFDRMNADNAIHEVFLAIQFMTEVFRSMNASLLYDMQKYHPAAFELFVRHKNDYLYGVIRDNLVRGVKEELYRPEIKIDILTRFRMESVSIPFNPEFHTRLKSGLAEIEEEMTLNFLYGLVSPKGYKLILKYLQEQTKKEQ